MSATHHIEPVEEHNHPVPHNVLDLGHQACAHLRDELRGSPWVVVDHEVVDIRTTGGL